MKLIFATNNQHKVQEIKAVLPSHLEVISLREAGIDIDIPEPHERLEENAAEKARVINNLTQSNCFSEDTGLEVTALQNEPGVRSARYAGDNASFDNNIDKLLGKMKGIDNRQARFRTVICLMWNDQQYFFEGICTGKITAQRSGAGGFGYDPVFIPDGAARSFAEMSMEEKNRYSHRRKATDLLVAFLNNH